MSAEPPPPDWVQSDAAFHHRRSILDGDDAGRTRSNPRVVLESVPRASILVDPALDDRERPATGAWQGSVDHRRTDWTSLRRAFVATVRREWEDLAFTTRRLNRLVALLGFAVVLALAILGWQRGTLSGMAAEFANERGGIDGTPAAPRLSSDQVAWTDVRGGDDGRRSTAGFTSDEALAGPDGEPSSGAKLFVADGKSSKKAATSRSGDETTSGTRRDPSRVVESGADGDDAPGAGSTGGKRTETTTTVRYANCAEAVAAGAAPIRLGEPGYRLSLDQDKDGVACENGSTPEDRGDAPVDSLYSNQSTTTTPRASASTTSPGDGAGTTSTVESTTTSRSSTTASTTTTATATSKPTSTVSTTTTASVTTSTTIATTTTVAPSTTSPSTSSTTTTRPSASTTTTSTVPTTAPTTPTTVSTTVARPSSDPLGGPPTGPT